MMLYDSVAFWYIFEGFRVQNSFRPCRLLKDSKLEPPELRVLGFTVFRA